MTTDAVTVMSTSESTQTVAIMTAAATSVSANTITVMSS